MSPTLTIHTPYTTTHPSPFTILTPPLVPHTHHSQSSHCHSSPNPYHSTLLTRPLVPHHSTLTILTLPLVPHTHHSQSSHGHSSPHSPLTILTRPLVPHTHHSQSSHGHSSPTLTTHNPHTATLPPHSPLTILTRPLVPHTHHLQSSHGHSSPHSPLTILTRPLVPYPYHSTLLTPPLIRTPTTQHSSHHHSSPMHTAYLLADAGYDVWLGNYRGNTYSHSHVTLDPEKLSYWSFSWDEMAYYDIPAMIDYMLSVTGATGVYYTGWSMGTTGFFATMSERPEYNAKIKAMAALAPVAYVDHAKGPLKELAPFANDLDTIFTLLGMGELLPSTDWMDSMVETFCDIETQTAEVCYNLLFLIGGPDADELNKEYLPVILAHTPAGSSVHTINHYAQGMISGKFQKYDYGLVGNLNHYGQNTPPLYSLANVTAPVGLFWGNTDWLATPQDVARLASELPNVALNFNVPKPQFNHFDFGWGLHAKELVYDYLLDFFSQH
ncbi:hypothetical protein Pcinc_019388 [Petrolisthes cinctipes]|uniref:AB hydrolase-1 domain-containing protein n=1 Tax=Petrolisthes cinctipes TaxID=88211 RepID=A0AAE1FL53_PETCI|nr:hypothetical protein Pcinc_019388 [Petrolisthes cinctipes]